MLNLVMTTILTQGVQWRTRVIKQKALHLENEVNLRTATIAELLEQKERFFTHISHEFRTPLSLILRTVKHFKQRNSSTEEEALINSAQSNTYRLQRMVEQLLELACFNFSREVKPQNIGLADFSAGIIDALHSNIAEQHHRVEVNVEPNIVVWVEADALEKILMNLLSNAIKYTLAYGQRAYS
jgi:signal transduction histidine kinase